MIATLLSTTNQKFSYMIGSKGTLEKMPLRDNGFMFSFNSIQYWLRTSRVVKIDFEDCNTENCKMVVRTKNSIYEFKVSLSEKELIVNLEKGEKL